MIASILLVALVFSSETDAKCTTDIVPVPGDFTFEMTFRHEGTLTAGWPVSTGALAVYRSGYYDGWRLFLRGERVAFQIGFLGGADDSTLIETPASISRGAWHRLAATWRSTGDGIGEMRLMVDGVCQGVRRGVPQPEANGSDSVILGDAANGLGAARLEVADVAYSTARSDELLASAYLADAWCQTTGEDSALLRQVYTRGLEALKGTDGEAEAPEYPAERRTLHGFDGGEWGGDLSGVMLYRADGTPLRLARWPKGDGNYAEVEIADGIMRFTSLTPPEIKAGTRLFAQGYWRYFWLDQILPVEALEDGRFRILGSHLYGFGEHQIAALLNAPELMSERDEWIFDGERPIFATDDETVRLPRRRRPLASVEGNDEKLVYRNMDFCDSLGTGLELVGCTNVVIENCTFRRLGGNGVVLRACRDVTIRDCVFEEIGYTGLSIANAGNRETLEKANLVIERCTFTKTGRLQKTYTPGIYLEGCGAIIRNCRFHDLPSSGIRLEGNDHIVRDCVFERTVGESDDQGAIDMWGNPTYRGCVFFGNVFRGVGGGGKCACGRAGIRFDDMISGMTVVSNVFDHCAEGCFGGIQLHAGHYNAIVDNSFAGGRTAVSTTPWGIERWRTVLNESATKARMRGLETSPLYLARYPELHRLFDNHMLLYLRGNTFEE